MATPTLPLARVEVLARGVAGQIQQLDTQLQHNGSTDPDTHLANVLRVAVCIRDAVDDCGAECTLAQLLSVFRTDGCTVEVIGVDPEL